MQNNLNEQEIVEIEKWSISRVAEKMSGLAIIPSVITLGISALGISLDIIEKKPLNLTWAYSGSSSLAFLVSTILYRTGHKTENKEQGDKIR